MEYSKCAWAPPSPFPFSAENLQSPLGGDFRVGGLGLENLQTLLGCDFCVGGLGLENLPILASCSITCTVQAVLLPDFQCAPWRNGFASGHTSSDPFARVEASERELSEKHGSFTIEVRIVLVN